MSTKMQIFSSLPSSVPTVYEGMHKDGFMHGRGVYAFADGRLYDGEFVKGVREGRGNMTFKNGEKFSGFFKNNLEDGNGRYRFTNGIFREGAWLKGKRVRWLSGDKIGGMPTM